MLTLYMCFGLPVTLQRDPFWRQRWWDVIPSPTCLALATLPLTINVIILFTGDVGWDRWSW